MESIYKSMQSYPNQKDQIYYGPHYYPGMEAMPTQMHMNLLRPPMGYGCWPWGSNYAGASPIACHGCCNHSYLPAHCAWGSPYPHVLPHHCPGNYPPFPVQYMPPPPFYAVEQPRYVYEKNVPREHHCCGCINHQLHQEEQKNVRIEEEEPERERRNDDSLVPFQFKNSPYPIVWLPPDYSGYKEQGKVNNIGERKDGSRDVKVHEKDLPYPIVWLPPDYSSNKEQGQVKNTEDRRDGSRDLKAHENGKVAGQQPTFWNGWLPHDLNNLVSKKNRGDGEENHQQDDGKRNFPFPLFWMPYKPEEKEREKHKVKDANTTPSLESEKGSGGEQNFHVNRENIADQAASKVREIPVKEGDQHVEKETSIKQEKQRDASVKDSSDSGEKKVDNGEKVSPKEGLKSKSPSPPKSSKLPPVCLRVDPLPRRKNGNGSSRSLSPPGNKHKPESQSNDASKVLNSSEKKEQAKILHNELKEGKGAKTIEVVDGRTSQGNAMDIEVETPVKHPAKSQDDVSTNHAEEKPKEGQISQKYAENNAVVKSQLEDAGSARGENEGAQEMKADELKKSCKRELSEEEAAVIIQSAYRGFDVRRWEPIKKLKQIAKVREQIADVKHLIQAMKSSSNIQNRSKQRNIVAETIMGLLLKLDTIQGLHPSVREVRKSVVIELVSLQEQLDSLMNEKSEYSHGEESKRDEDSLNKSDDVILSQNGNETTPTDLLEAHQDQIDGGANHGNSEITDANLIGEEASEKIEKEAAESSMNKLVESAPEPTIKEDEKSNEVLENDETLPKEDHEDLVLSQGSGISSLQDDDSAKATDIAATDRETVGSELAELPIGVLDDFCAQESPNDVAVEADASNTDQAKQLEEASIESPTVSEPHETADDKDSNQTVETREVFDLPFNGVTVEPETEETCPIKRSLENGKSDDKLGSEEEVDSRTGDARIKPDECTAQQPQNFIADMIEPSEASDEIENCTCNKENSEVTDSNSLSVSEEPLDAPTEKEVPSHLLQVGNLEQGTCLINEIANSDEATDMIGVEGAVEARIIDSEEVSEEKQPQIIEASQTHTEVPVDVPQQGEESKTEESLPKETLKEQGLKDASAHEENAVDSTWVKDSPARDEVTESNQKLIEENEQLREMMERLIKSGQEQRTALSSLSGRVKDLEKKLSRKKKLKLKQYKAPRSGS